MLALKKDEPPEVFRQAIVHREWGHRFFSLANYPLAVEYFKKSKAEDLRTLLILCRALIKNAHYAEGKELSEKCVALCMTTLDHVQRNSSKYKLKIQGDATLHFLYLQVQKVIKLLQLVSILSTGFRIRNLPICSLIYSEVWKFMVALYFQLTFMNYHADMLALLDK
jgi:hypothetical protein